MEDNWTPPSDAEVTDWTPPSDAQVIDEPVKKKLLRHLYKPNHHQMV